MKEKPMQILNALAHIVAHPDQYNCIIREFDRLSQYKNCPAWDMESMLAELIVLKKRLASFTELVPDGFNPVSEAEKYTCDSCKGSGDHCDGDGYHYGNYHTCSTCKGHGYLFKITCRASKEIKHAE